MITASSYEYTNITIITTGIITQSLINNTRLLKIVHDLIIHYYNRQIHRHTIDNVKCKEQ